MIFLISLFFIIVIHEAAHCIVAKRYKCQVDIFAVGFGRTLWQKKIGKTMYQLNILLLGGFCQLKDEFNYSRSKLAFTNKTYSQKVAIALAGIAANLITGLLAINIAFHIYCSWLFMFGFYSVLMGISNLLPIPALDGSYPLIFLFEKRWGKKKTYKIWGKIIKYFFVFIMTLNILSIPLLIYWLAIGQIR